MKPPIGICCHHFLLPRAGQGPAFCREMLLMLFRADLFLIIAEVRHMVARIASVAHEMFNFHI